MPGKVKVKIIAGKNLPVMDRSSDTTDAYVEIKLGSTSYKTDVCRKSLNPQWNSEWYRFEVDDSELQDEPLQIRVMDHDTYSANDAIGKVYLNLNPLLLASGGLLQKFGWNGETTSNSENVTNSVMTGWVPVFDTMHGIRGEINVIVKVELFSDFNKFRQSSCGVQFFCSPVIPHGHYAQSINGFVEELIVNDDPEYQWIDKIRTPRASNEARQTLFFKLCGELQRKIGVKALELGGNAVVGYSQCFDLEGESGVVARGIGTAVTLIKLKDHHAASNADGTTEERALSYLRFLRYDSGFYLNRENHNNPHPVLSLSTSDLSPQKPKDTYETSATKRNFTRHLSYNEFSPTRSNLSLNRTYGDNIHHASSVQTLLKQEDLRGIPGTGFSQRIKNLKYSSQSMLSKKMTALKARLSESGMPEEETHGSTSSIPSISMPDRKRIALFQKTGKDSCTMAELLVKSLMNTSLDCIAENRDSPARVTKDETAGGDALKKSVSEVDILLLDDESSSDSSSSEEETVSDGQDEPRLYYDTVSNIIKNVEINTADLSEESNEDAKFESENVKASDDTVPLAKQEDFMVDNSPVHFFLDDEESNSSESFINSFEISTHDLRSVKLNLDSSVMQAILFEKLNRLDSYTSRSSSSSTSKDERAFGPERTKASFPDPDPDVTRSIRLTNFDKTLTCTTISEPSSYSNIVLPPKMPDNLELVQGNNNMHASLDRSLRTVGSPVAETIRNDYGHQRTESVGAKISQSPARFQPIPFMHRRSSDSDLSVTPKGNSLTGSDKSCGYQGGYFSRGGAFLRTAIPQDNFDMLEYPFLTMSKYPPGCIICLGGVVSARSVKLLERITNLEEPESRDTWWTEIRMEIRSHARTLNCNAVLGYSETTSICDDVCVLSASGTAAVIGFQYTGEINDFISALPAASKSYYFNNKDVASSLDRTDDKIVQKPESALWANTNTNTKALTESPEREQQTFINNVSSCTICHLPYTGNTVPMRTSTLKCSVCRLGKVPDILLATIEMPEGIPSIGRGCFIQAYVCRQLKDLRSESNAKDISDGLPFLEYELHRILVNKIKVKGMNAVFGLKVEISIGIKMLVGIATGTAVFLLPLPPPALPKLVSDRSTDEKKLAEMQKLLYDTVKVNKEIYQLKIADDTQNGRISPENETNEDDQPVFELSAENRDTCVLEVDDPEDMEIMNLLMEPRPPDGFHVVNTELVPGLDELEIVKNLQMFTQIWRAKLQPPYNLGKHIHKLLESVYFKLRRMIPCALCDLQFRIDLPESDEIQLSVLGMALGLGVLSKVTKQKRKNIYGIGKENIKKNDEEMIFNLEEDHAENATVLNQSSNLLNVQNIKHRGKSPQRLKITSKQHVPCRERHGVDITPLSYVPGGKIERYLGNLNFFFIRETTSVREEGGLSGFIHSFVTEVLAIVRAHIAALGGNAMVAYYMTECVLSYSLHKNQKLYCMSFGLDSYLGHAYKNHR